MADNTAPRWEGKAIAELKGPAADQAWSFLEKPRNYLYRLLILG